MFVFIFSRKIRFHQNKFDRLIECGDIVLELFDTDKIVELSVEEYDSDQLFLLQLARQLFSNHSSLRLQRSYAYHSLFELLHTQANLTQKKDSVPKLRKRDDTNNHRHSHERNKHDTYTGEQEDSEEKLVKRTRLKTSTCAMSSSLVVQVRVGLRRENEKNRRDLQTEQRQQRKGRELTFSDLVAPAIEEIGHHVKRECLLFVVRSLLDNQNNHLCNALLNASSKLIYQKSLFVSTIMIC